jgi:hypothetical protein
MATVPEVPPAGQTSAQLEARFRQLATVWLEETAHVSSSTELVNHPAFQQIVALGRPVVPLLLRELAARTGHWHRALKCITGADPVPPEGRGDFDQATEAWLRWGRDNGYQW